MTADPGTRARVEAIPLFGVEWTAAGRALSVLISSLREDDAERLFENISHMSEPPPISEEMAVNWFLAIRDLPSCAIVTAIQEFLHLGWTWNQIGPSTGISFEELLAFLYRAFETLSENPADMELARELIRCGFTWPERFAYILDRIRTGGAPVIRAIERARELMPEASPGSIPVLVDFAVGIGWYLLEEEDLPIWRLVGRNGELLYKRLRGLSLPRETLRLLAGFLGRMEESGQMERLLEFALPRTMLSIVGDMPGNVMEDALVRLSRGTVAMLKRKAESEICLSMLSFRGELDEPLETGRALADVLLFAGPGEEMADNLYELLEITGHDMDSRVVRGLASVLEERRGREEYAGLGHEILMDFMRTSWELLAGGEGYSRKKVHSIGRLMDAVFGSTDPAASVRELKARVRESAHPPETLLFSCTMLLRGTERERSTEALEQCGAFANIITLLDADYRRRLLEGDLPAWLAPVRDAGREATEDISRSLERISERELRGRFLDRLVTPLLVDCDPTDPLFSELLSSGVATYNRDLGIEQLREAETELLGKLFRAEDRSRAVQDTMRTILNIPGIEDHRASELIQGTRELCEELSRQAVWLEEKGNRMFRGFLSRGLQDFFRALIENPGMADRLTGGLTGELLGKVIQDGERERQVARWQMATLVELFGRIVPLSAEIMAGRPDLFEEYLREMAGLSVRSMHGEPAGHSFLGWTVPVLERQLVEEFIRRLDDESPLDGIPEGIVPQALFDGWSGSRNSAFVILRACASRLKPFLASRTRRRILAREGRRLVEGLLGSARADFLEPEAEPELAGTVSELADYAADTDLIEVVRCMESGFPDPPPPWETAVRGFFQRFSPPEGENPCRHWRERALTQLDNIMVDVLLLCSDMQSLKMMDSLLDEFVEVVGYLSASDGVDLPVSLDNLSRSLSAGLSRRGSRGVRAAGKSLEKTLYTSLWRRNATQLISAAVGGRVPTRQLVSALFDRLAEEDSARDRLLFTRRYGSVFAAVESGVLSRKTTEIKAFRSVLEHVWVFNAASDASGSMVENAREAVETYVQYFREVGARTGAVSAPEAGAISLGMKRRYRDNANTVATLLKWTQDPERESLLALVEAHQPLLEAVSRDAELTRLLDELWTDPKTKRSIKSMADRPAELRKRLMRAAGRWTEDADSGLHYV